jgi:hypothetical protein
LKMNTPSVFGGNRQIPSVNQAARAGLKGPAHPRISIRGGAFTCIDSGGQEYPAPVLMHPSKRIPMLLAVIIGANGNKSKMFYPPEEQWTPDSNMPPLCFSDNGIGPSSLAQEPQSLTCAACRWDKWGSAKSRLTGEDIKACSDRKKLAVMLIGDSTSLAYELQVPPASLNGLSDYGAKIAARQLPGGNREPDLCDAVTMINFAPGKVGVLEFEQIAWIDSVGIGQGGITYLNYDSNGIQMAPDGGWGIAERMGQYWSGGTVELLVNARDVPYQAPSGAPALPGMSGQPAPYIEHQAGTGHVGQLPQPAMNTPYPGSFAQQGQPPVQHQQHPQGPYAPPPGAQPSNPVGSFQPPAQLPPPNPPHAPSGTATVAGPAPATNQPPPVPSRGRGGARAGAGRKPRGAQTEQGNVVQHPAMAAQNPQQQEGIPPFLQRVDQSQGGMGGGAPHPNQAGPAGTQGHVGQNQPANGGAGNFGMTGAPPPPPGLENALSKAFELRKE